MAGCSPSDSRPTSSSSTSRSIPSGKDVLEAISLGDIPGIGMVVIDGHVRTGRSRARRRPPTRRRHLMEH